MATTLPLHHGGVDLAELERAEAEAALRRLADALAATDWLDDLTRDVVDAVRLHAAVTRGSRLWRLYPV